LQSSSKDSRALDFYQGLKLDIAVPFLGSFRPFVGRCCQKCTPKSWESLFHKHLTSLGFCNVIKITEENTRSCSWKPPLRVAQGLLPRPLFVFCPVRLGLWALLKLLSWAFLRVVAHRGQLEMVRRATRAPDVPVVFLATHKSQLDGPLLQLLLASQGLPMPRVAWEHRAVGPKFRALLTRLGGVCLPQDGALPSGHEQGALSRAVLAAVRRTSYSWSGGKTRVALGCGHVRAAWHLAPKYGPTLSQASPSTRFSETFCHTYESRSAIISPFLSTQGVFLSRLMQDFAWLTEEVLLRSFDVGFSGRVWDVVQHTLLLLQPCLRLHRLSLGDVLVAPKRTEAAVTELSRHSAALLPVFLPEAVGACAVNALLVELLPFLGSPEQLRDVVVVQQELHSKILLLVQLLPKDFLLCQPCQSVYSYCQVVVDKLIQCGVLVAEEVPSDRSACDAAQKRFTEKLLWKASDDFGDSDSDCGDEAERRCFKVGEALPNTSLLGRAHPTGTRCSSPH
uniref:Glycerol-3-phosphate acyltransferase 2, mitochondrial n=1 Tax=Varanus komodoensis TaxID=61221 RepID=A0A8D2LIA8_VARKO